MDTVEFKDKVLLLLGHGSSKHPDSSRSVRMHAEVIRQQGVFKEVHTAFLKEDLLVERALDEIDYDEVIIVLDFLAEGYFTRQVIPRLLKLAERDSRVAVSHPVGIDAMMSTLLAEAAAAVLGEWKSEETSLLLVGHGSTKSSQSKQTMLGHMGRLHELTDFAEIGDLWLEEAPFVPEWSEVSTQKQVIVIPFLLSDGQHGGWDIPEELGVADGVAVHGVTHELQGREVRMAPALGSTENFAKVILPAAMKARKIELKEERGLCLYQTPCEEVSAQHCKAEGCPRLG